DSSAHRSSRATALRMLAPCSKWVMRSKRSSPEGTARAASSRCRSRRRKRMKRPRPCRTTKTAPTPPRARASETCSRNTSAARTEAFARFKKGPAHDQVGIDRDHYGQAEAPARERRGVGGEEDPGNHERCARPGRAYRDPGFRQFLAAFPAAPPGA